MAGGTFLTKNKVRPGAYVNIAAEAKTSGSISDRGIVVLPMDIDWGAKLTVINSGDNTFSTLGYDISDPKMLLVREALKNASKVYVYRMNSGKDDTEKAKAIIRGITATAKYFGELGNAITIEVLEELKGEESTGYYNVKTSVGSKLVDSQRIKTVNDLSANDWVTFSGALADEPAAESIKLTGGKNGTVDSYADFMEYIQTLNFNTAAFPINEEDAAKILPLVKEYIERLREDEGIKVQAVVPYFESVGGMNYEGIIQVYNGFIMADGTEIDKVKATAWVAGTAAGAAVNESNTYKKYDGALEASPLLLNSEIIELIGQGMWLFTGSDGNVRVETDINSFTEFSAVKPRGFSKNRVIRVIDSIGNDIKDIFESMYIGKVDNSEQGRNLFKKEVLQYFETMQNINAIQNFDPDSDVIVEQGDELDQVICDCYIQPVDSMEKLYMSVALSI